MHTAKEWAELRLGPDAALVLGWRINRKLHAGRLSLHRTMDQALRVRAQATLNELDERTVRAYDPSAFLEEDEAFLLTTDDLPRQSPPLKGTGGDEVDGGVALLEVSEPSALAALVLAPEALQVLAADDVRGRRFLFYAAVFSQSGKDHVAFLKHHNPAAVLKSGRLLGMYGQTVTTVKAPILIFEEDFDLAIDGENIVALKPNSVPQLFVDIEATAAAVPAYVSSLAQMKLAIPPESQAVIRSMCSKRMLARRLEILLRSPHLAQLTPQKIRRYLGQTGQDPSRFLQGDSIVVREADVSALLDVLGALLYRHGYDGQLRRADRSSLVKGV